MLHRCARPKAARLAIEAPPISVPDPDATPMQLEESEEARRPKHRALPANVSKDLSGHGVITERRARQWMTRTDQG